MKSINDVIDELNRAADAVHTLSEGQRLRLLRRAYVTIREGWKAAGQPERLQDSAETIDLAHVGDIPLHLQDNEMEAVLLEAVKAIRQIEAAIKAKTTSQPGNAGHGR
jgi:hypothetical protein